MTMFTKTIMAGVMLLTATAANAQTSVWGVRVLATDAEAVATFYEKTFGMSEVSRPVNSATTKEIVINFGATPEIAKKATTAGLAIYTRPANTMPGTMPALIMRVADLDKAMESVKANGGAVTGRVGRNAIANVSYVFVKDPDGNPIELIVDAK